MQEFAELIRAGQLFQTAPEFAARLAADCLADWLKVVVVMMISMRHCFDSSQFTVSSFQFTDVNPSVWRLEAGNWKLETYL